MKCSLLVLSTYLDGELESRRQGELEAHLVGCQRCRAGLGYLREEVERIGSLGRVHVAAHSSHALLVQLGMAAAEDAPPPRTGVGVAVVEPDWPQPQPAAHVEPEPQPEAFERPDFRWVSTPEAIPSVPHPVAPPGPPPWPPPPTLTPDDAPSAPPSGGAFPPGGPEASEHTTHVTAPGGEPEMTASPPWAPHDAPSTPVYPLTDDDVLHEPVPIERFGPPLQAPRPSFLDRLRDRFATRRALSRSSSAYDDSVQIVSGSGAPLRSGRARQEVERRRQEALRAETHASVSLEAADDVDEVDPELGLGPLPPLAERLAATPMPRPAAPAPSHIPSLPGQMSLPGTATGHEIPPLPRPGAPLTPIGRTPMPPLPPARHSLSSALGDVPPPPRPSTPPAVPPPAPVPDPLGEALSGLDRQPGGAAEARPWRPREIPEDIAPPRRYAAPPVTRDGPTPSQLREGRRLLALFGAAALLMLVVGIVSGRTTSPLPTSSPQAQTSAPPQAQPSQPAAKASAAPTQISLGPGAQAPQPAATAQLTGIKLLGDLGTGYQVKGFRYGIHPNDFRIVLDLDASGAASGTPKATLGFLDSTTLIVALAGVVPAGSTGQLPSSNPVVSVTLMQQSPIAGTTAYQIKLAHPVTFAAGYATSPLRLVIDIAG